MLLSFIYVLRQKASAGQWQRRLEPGKGKATYYLEPGTGRLTWDHHLNTSLSQMLAHIHSVDQFLALLAPDIRSDMQARWQAVQRGEVVKETFQFQLNGQTHHHLQLQESKLIGLSGPGGIAVVGYLEENPHSVLSFHHSRGG
ncbi:hypothetical protein Q4491_16565 [Photobacterium sp. 2_MG-2023]|uniref:hypothetical protein n=1 Tax=Photobacterium sp. 2_MG-2023 TaxID=3062663 RepID=UPI0026E203CF|nr:hypothetical protein [Photobacterium sp. 2_MG-2023]MDO6582956.1 hypothetical protein [Photobacterium sp. 2_MG-2023]